MKFEIGQTVWFAHTSSIATFPVCPECLGNKTLTCILGDGTHVAIDCRSCERGGWVGSRGTLEVYVHTAIAEPATITGIEVGRDGVTYSALNSFWSKPEDEVFATETEALAKAAELENERNTEAVKRSLCKEKDTKSWAWHVTYHRQAIVRAQKELEYHTSKLELSKTKCKAEGRS
jgi:hypothetical protein